VCSIFGTLQGTSPIRCSHGRFTRGQLEAQVSLDQMLTVGAEDRAPGLASNEKKWTQVPRGVSVRQLLEYSGGQRQYV